MPCFPFSQVRSFFTLCWRQSPVLFDELGYLRDVHGPLRARILRHVGAQIRPQLPILQARAPCAAQNFNLNIQTCLGCVHCVGEALVRFRTLEV
jgi:hypothetical protein